ncbi:glycosyltransferase [Thermosynechococcus sp. PP22]|uniref:glycosyltransferase family 2 protein n=1 Tax=Thermosynechococcus sp. PP22 TaxID=3074082 RepID=UPI0028734FFD|nr:glycosyltransferase [Thermosynechococcus sp. PP22]WNC23380.1 glycosyltransferase [Thermosynechococcus sp. PP22]
MFFSVVIPTYNRLPILEKCVRAIAHQTWNPDLGIEGYEVIIVDDGSTDNTIEWLEAHREAFPCVRWFQQEHLGPAAARNLGLQVAQGDWIIFIDSDLVVTETFLEAHGKCLTQEKERLGIEDIAQVPAFSYGRVINTCNFEEPTSEPYKIIDFSAAYFATGNVAIARHWLEKAGLFDTQFQLYGWEDLELGVRLKQLGLRLLKCPAAVGYHWHPPFSLSQVPTLIQKEIERGRMGVLFYKKHPIWEVKLMIQMTPFHYFLWAILSLGGILNEKTLAPLLQWLINIGRPQDALEVARIFLNWYNVRAVYSAYQEQTPQQQH